MFFPKIQSESRPLQKLKAEIRHQLLLIIIILKKHRLGSSLQQLMMKNRVRFYHQTKQTEIQLIFCDIVYFILPPLTGGTLSYKSGCTRSSRWCRLIYLSFLPKMKNKIIFSWVNYFHREQISELQLRLMFNWKSLIDL